MDALPPMRHLGRCLRRQIRSRRFPQPLPFTFLLFPLFLLFLRRTLVRCHARDDNTESGAAARLRRYADAAAETASHDVVHDVQAEAGPALAAARREERLEC